jgi:hypothetical protein
MLAKPMPLIPVPIRFTTAGRAAAFVRTGARTARAPASTRPLRYVEVRILKILVVR